MKPKLILKEFAGLSRRYEYREHLICKEAKNYWSIHCPSGYDNFIWVEEAKTLKDACSWIDNSLTPNSIKFIKSLKKG